MNQGSYFGPQIYVTLDHGQWRCQCRERHSKVLMTRLQSIKCEGIWNSFSLRLKGWTFEPAVMKFFSCSFFTLSYMDYGFYLQKQFVSYSYKSNYKWSKFVFPKDIYWLSCLTSKWFLIMISDILKFLAF
jgi:hypothetical protein